MMHIACEVVIRRPGMVPAIWRWLTQRVCDAIARRAALVRSRPVAIGTHHASICIHHFVTVAHPCVVPHCSPVPNPLPSRYTTPVPDEGFRSSRTRTRGRGYGWEILGELASARTAAILIAGIGITTVLASFYEKAYGTRAVQVLIYQSWWFTTLWALVVIAIVGAVVVRWPLKRAQLGFATVHAGLVTLTLGFFVAGHDRLDGILGVDEGREGSHIDLPMDRVMVLDQGGGETRWWQATFQPLGWAGYPGLTRFLLSPLLPVPPIGIEPVDPPHLLARLPSGLEIHATAICDTGAPQQAWVASEGRDAQPAMHVSLAVRPPMAEEFQPFTEAWMAESDGAQLHFAGMATASFRHTESAELVEDFLAGPSPTGSLGVFTYYSPDGRIAIDLDAQPLPLTKSLPQGGSLTVVRVVLHPGEDASGQLIEDPTATVNPAVEFIVDTPGSGTRSLLALAYLPTRRADDRDLEYLYRAPQQVDPAEGSGQGVYLQGIAGPDGRLHLRSFSRTAGSGTVATLAADAETWIGDLGAGASGAMALRAVIRWLPAAAAGPQPIQVPATKREAATRWIRMELGRPGGAPISRWFRRGDRLSLTVPGHGEVLLQYAQATRNLADSNGFSLRLDRFENGKDPGGGGNATFASEVTVLRPGQGQGNAQESRHRITMNEPLTIDGVTLYQTSFSQRPDADGVMRTTSFFTVAEDRGRVLKYLGSLLLVAGTLWWYLGRRR